MTDRYCQVDGCGRPIPRSDNSPACPRCWTQHRQHLAELPFLIDETTHTLARQNSATGHNATRRGETPLPYSQAASDALTALLALLRAWALLADDDGHHIPRIGTLNAHTLARRLLTLDYHHWPHNHDAAPDYIRELDEQNKRLRRIIFTPAAPEYFGDCPHCGTELQARRDAAAARCHTCGTITARDDRDEIALTLASDKLWGFDQANDVLTRYAGYAPLTRTEVQRLERKGHLTPAGHTPDGEPLYRLSDLQHVAHLPQHVVR